MITIRAQILDNHTNEVLMDRIFSEEYWLNKDKPLTVQSVMEVLEIYIVGEGLQAISEIKLRAKLVCP